MNNIIEINNQTRYLVFDLGNTLYPHSIQVEAWKEALKGSNYDVDQFLELYKTIYKPNQGGFSSIKKLDQVFKMMDLISTKSDEFEVLLKYKNALRIGIDKYLSTDPHGTFEFLKEIKPYFEKLGILSDNSIETKIEWSLLLKKHAFDIFDFFIVSEEINTEKPDEKAFMSIIDKIGSFGSPNKIMYFGDDLTKDRGSQDLGMNFVLVYGHRENEGEYSPKIRYINNKWIQVKL